MDFAQAPALVLEPADELTFQDKLGHIVGVTLLIKNKNAQDVYFKVKSTATKFYSVRPSSGIIKPHSQSKVILQPRDDSPSSLDIIEAKKHRFLVQSAFVDRIHQVSAEDFWKNIDDQQDSQKVATARLRAKVFRIQPSTTQFANPNGNIMENKATVNASPFASGVNSIPIGGGKVKKEAVVVEKNSTPKLDEATNDAKEMMEAMLRIESGRNVDIGIKDENKSEVSKNGDDENQMPKQPTEGMEPGIGTTEKKEQEIEQIHNETIDSLTGAMNAPFSSGTPIVQHPMDTSSMTIRPTASPPPSSLALMPAPNLYNTSFYGHHFLNQPSGTNFNEGVNDTFGRYVAKILDSLPNKSAISMKKEINELISKYEQQEI